MTIGKKLYLGFGSILAIMLFLFLIKHIHSAAAIQCALCGCVDARRRADH